MRLRQLLGNDAQTVSTIAHDGTVEEAIDRMMEQHTSALIVMKDGQPVGIFTGQDVLRCYTENLHRRLAEIRLSDGMTNKLIVASHDDEVGSSLQMMLQTDIKHLPVEADGKIIGMLSLQTMVQRHVEALTGELTYLQDYISDLQSAGQD